MCGKPLPLESQACRFPVALLISVTLLALSLNVTTDRMPNPREVRPLPDMGHQILPFFPQLEHVTDTILALFNILIIFLVFKLYLLHRQASGESSLVERYQWIPRVPYFTDALFGVWEASKDPSEEPFPRKRTYLVAWIRFWCTFAVLSLFRAPVILLTSYPATDNHCQNPPVIENPAWNAVLTVLTFGSGSIHCGDLMFSGHTVSGTLAFMCLWTYGPMVWGYFRPLASALLLGTWFTILTSRSHYTDDVVVAVYLTVATYWLIPHNEREGAPLPLQAVIRWWPSCCGAHGGEAIMVDETAHSMPIHITPVTAAAEQCFTSTVVVAFDGATKHIATDGSCASIVAP